MFPPFTGDSRGFAPNEILHSIQNDKCELEMQENSLAGVLGVSPKIKVPQCMGD